MAGATAIVSTTAEGRSAEERALAAAIDTTPSIQFLLDRHARERPDACALACNSALGGWLKVSWSRLAEDSRRSASGLRALGVKPGEHIAIVLDNRAAYECYVGYLGLLRCGAALVPVNARSTIDELGYIFRAAECRWIIATSELAEIIDAARAEAPEIRGVIGIGGCPESWADWQYISNSTPDLATEVAVGPDTVSSVLFTSGTTARPKGAVHTHRTSVYSGAAFSKGLKLGAEDVFHHAVPFFTSSGAQMALMIGLWSGCEAVIEPIFDSARMVARMVEEGTTAVAAVPAQYIFMMEALRARKSELGRVRLWDYGGAPMPSEMIHALADLFPAAEQRQNYGMTETGPAGTVLPPEYTFSKLGSVGLPIPLCDTLIVDEAGHALGPDEVGEICIRSPGNMLGYYGNPEATAVTLVNDWIRTGDIGRKDADGFLWYLDRLKDVINRGGLKISSMEIEEALFRHSSVLETAVVAVPHPRLGEDIRAFVVARPGTMIDREELRAHCADRLAAHKVPRDIRFVESLPRNSMGKVQKTALRQLE